MILDEIIANTRLELEARKKSLPEVELRRAALEQPLPLDFASALRGKRLQLIAEVKKASPSRGVIRADFKPVEIARIYADNGASAISVLTETGYFQGSLNYLRDIKEAPGNKLPLLRKDFIFEPYQVYESRAYGADALLLIVAILTPEKLKELSGLSHELKMGCLVEVHNEAELEIALNSGAKIIGINNRDLSTFKVDITTTERLRPLIPQDRIVVSESGIKSRSDIEKLEGWGVDAVLIGEALMDTPDIAAKIKELIKPAALSSASDRKSSSSKRGR
ncbi:MAG: indole-3-glycerol phosphate synthase TrpC [Dehalococcoidales bacterium]|nr:indole-3-glycerol phosphate synthase TrpC [Dehalococcoidales bacterium]MDZ4231141.1 indole-3-glycerol phosphate synthase TrpC [Dehalococcoidales bacterium]